MTTYSLSITASGTFGGQKISKSLSYSGSIPDDQIITPSWDGVSLVATQSAGAIHFGLHVPFLGQIVSQTVSEAGTYSISKTIDGVTFRGSLTVS